MIPATFPTSAVGFETTPNFRKLLTTVSNRQALVAAIGDSQTANCTYGAASYTNRGYYANGYVSEARSLSGQRFIFPIEYNKGIGGQSTDQIIPRIATDILTLPTLPDICFVNAGSNPGTGNTWDALSFAIKSLTEAGIVPVLIAPVPKNNQTAAERSSHIAQIEWLRNLASGRKDLMAAAGLTGQNPFVVVNANAYITDYTSATSDPLTGMLQDGLHYSPLAAFQLGREAARVLAPVLFGPDVPFNTDLRDQYIAGTGGAVNKAPNGSLIAPELAIMLGTAGSVASDVFAGSTVTNNGLNTGLTYRRWSGNSTSAVTLSKVAKRDTNMNGTRQRIDISVTGPAATSPQGTDQYRFTTQAAAANLVAGDYCYVEAEVELISGVNVRSMELTLNGCTDGKQCGYNITTKPHVRILRSPPTLVPATPAALQAEFSVFTQDAAGSQASVAFDRMVVRKCSALG